MIKGDEVILDAYRMNHLSKFKFESLSTFLALWLLGCSSGSVVWKQSDGSPSLSVSSSFQFAARGQPEFLQVTGGVPPYTFSALRGTISPITGGAVYQNSNVGVDQITVTDWLGDTTSFEPIVPPTGLDDIFGSSGITKITDSTTSYAGGFAAPAPDGSIVVGGTLGTTTEFITLGFTALGVPEPGFGNTVTSLAAETSLAMTMDSAGRSTLAGVDASGNSSIARYEPNGALDVDFNTQTSKNPATTGRINSLAAMGDGSIVTITYDTTLSQATINRLTASGNVDVGFHPALIGTSAATSGMAIQSDGMIVLALSTTTAPHQIQVFRLQSDGSPDPAFRSVAFTLSPVFSGNDDPVAVTIQPDGKIIVAAVPNPVTTQFEVLRLNSDGMPDSTFGTSGAVSVLFSTTKAAATSVALESNGELVIAGYAIDATGSKFAIAYLLPNGVPDPNFNAGSGTSGTFIQNIGGNSADVANSVFVQPDGGIVLTGISTPTIGGSLASIALARFWP